MKIEIVLAFSLLMILVSIQYTLNKILTEIRNIRQILPYLRKDHKDED